MKNNNSNSPIEWDESQENWIRSGPIFPKTLRVNGRNGNTSEFIILDRDENGCVKDIKDRKGFKGFVLKVQDPNTKAICAAKICIPADYDNDSRNENIESALASKLRQSGELFIVPFCVGRISPFEGMPGSQTDYVCFVSDWVTGETVENIA